MKLKMEDVLTNEPTRVSGDSVVDHKLQNVTVLPKFLRHQTEPALL